MDDARKRRGREVPGQSVIDQQKVQNEIIRTRVFDRDRKLPPENFYVHIPFVKSISAFNPQPVRPILIETLLKQRRRSMAGVMNRLTSDQAKMGETVKSTIALTSVRKGVIGRVALHGPAFPLPQMVEELPQTGKLNLMDKFFIYVNSIGKKK